MANGGHLFAVSVLIGPRRLVPHQLRLGRGMLALSQPREMLRTDLALQPKLCGKFALPFAVSLMPPAPIVRLLGRKLPRVIRPRSGGAPPVGIVIIPPSQRLHQAF